MTRITLDISRRLRLHTVTLQGGEEKTKPINNAVKQHERRDGNDTMQNLEEE